MSRRSKQAMAKSCCDTLQPSSAFCLTSVHIGRRLADWLVDTPLRLEWQSNRVLYLVSNCVCAMSDPPPRMSTTPEQTASMIMYAAVAGSVSRPISCACNPSTSSASVQRLGPGRRSLFLAVAAQAARDRPWAGGVLSWTNRNQYPGVLHCAKQTL